MDAYNELLRRWEGELIFFEEDQRLAESPKPPEMDETAPHDAPSDSQMWQVEDVDVNWENPLMRDPYMGCPCDDQASPWDDQASPCDDQASPCDDQASPWDDQASPGPDLSKLHNYAAPVKPEELVPACPVFDTEADADKAVDLLLDGHLYDDIAYMLSRSPATCSLLSDESEVVQEEQDVAAQVTGQEQESMQPAVPQMQSAVPQSQPVVPQRSTPVPQCQAAVSQKSTPAARKQTPSQRQTAGVKRKAPPPKGPAPKRPTPGPNRPTPFSEWHPAAVKQPAAAAAATVEFSNIDAMSASAVHTVSGTMYHQRSLISRLPAAQTSNAPKRRGRPPANPGLEHDYSRRPPQRPTGRRAAPKKTRVPKTTKSQISKDKHNLNERQRRAHLREEVTQLQTVVREGSELGPEVHKKLSQSKTLVCAAKAVLILMDKMREIGLNPHLLSQQHWE